MTEEVERREENLARHAGGPCRVSAAESAESVSAGSMWPECSVKVSFFNWAQKQTQKLLLDDMLSLFSQKMEMMRLMETEGR